MSVQGEWRTGVDGMKILSVVIESWIVIEELIGFCVFVDISEEQSEEDRETDNPNTESNQTSMKRNRERENLNRLSEKNRKEETSDDRCDPLLSYEITELNASDNNEENRNHDEDQSKAVSDEQTLLRQSDWTLLLLLHHHRSRIECRCVLPEHCLSKRWEKKMFLSRLNASKQLNHQKTRNEWNHFTDHTNVDLKTQRYQRSNLRLFILGEQTCLGVMWRGPMKIPPDSVCFSVFAPWERSQYIWYSTASKWIGEQNTKYNVEDEWIDLMEVEKRSKTTDDHPKCYDRPSSPRKT